MRTVSLFIFAFSIFIVLFTIYLCNTEILPSDYSIPRKNVEKIKLVELGMDSLQVIQIMGQPLEKREFKREIFFDYEVPQVWSTQCQIIFDSTGSVTYVSNVGVE
jgi:outer membrane protein assembly factor BamE (lipoprotein component of BamABCDE complex)